MERLRSLRTTATVTLTGLGILSSFRLEQELAGTSYNLFEKSFISDQMILLSYNCIKLPSTIQAFSSMTKVEPCPLRLLYNSLHNRYHLVSGLFSISNNDSWAANPDTELIQHVTWSNKMRIGGFSMLYDYT